MRYLHTMLRITDVDASLAFWRDALGLEVLSRRDYPSGRYTLIFLAAPGDGGAQIELTWNWDPEVYTGGDRPWVYYTQMDGDLRVSHRCEVGL